MQENDIILGDIVSFKWFIDFDTIVTVFGRVIGFAIPGSGVIGMKRSPVVDVFYDKDFETNTTVMNMFMAAKNQQKMLEEGTVVIDSGKWPMTGPGKLIMLAGDAENCIDDSLELSLKKSGFCPRCGDDGEWFAMACTCRHHKTKFIG